MSVRVSFYYAEGSSLTDILFREYAGFRQRIMESKAGKTTGPAISANVQDFLSEHAVLPTADSIDEILLNQLTADLWEFLSHEKHAPLYLGSVSKLDTFEKDLLWTTESEALYCWNFLVYGRSAKDPAKFFRAIDPQVVKLGYWTGPERKMMEDQLGRVYRRGIFPAISSVSQILQDHRHLQGQFLFSIS